jgi:glycosyltransferase involved in cell wall biosynthesis
LVAAAEAARRNLALYAFDAEDFESGYYSYDSGPSAIDHLTEDIEGQYLPACSYVSAASPGIAEAYRSKYPIPHPATVLNVFRLAERPSDFRSTDASGTLRLYWFSQTVGLGRGLEDVIAAMGKLRNCSIELHVRGRCTPQIKRALQLLGDSAGVSRERIITHPPASPGDMIEMAGEYDVGMALERRDSENHDLCLSNKIFTYLLAGNAVVATRTRAQRALMDTIGEAGFSYDPGNIDSLATGLRRWYEDRQLLHQARRQSWEWGTRQFNWDCEKKNFLQLVHCALNKEMRGTIVGR